MSYERSSHMTHLGNVPFLDHPLENWLFVIAVAVIAIALWVLIFIIRRRKPSEPPRQKYDDETNPWEAMERNKSENIADKKK